MTTKATAMGSTDYRTARKVDNNTVEWIGNDGVRHIRLHRTDILTFNHDGTINVSMGGWPTVTTRSRINKYLPGGYSVFQRNYSQYIRYPSGETFEFFDGMVIPSL